MASRKRNERMVVTGTLEALGYLRSPNFLSRDGNDLERVVEYAHIFRRAISDCALQGVYVLRDPSGDAGRSVVPVVYVCQAGSDQETDRIHRLVWNQNVVPFLLIQTPDHINFCSGFRYYRPSPAESQVDAARGVLSACIAFNEVASRLRGLSAASIDDGSVWSLCGNAVTPESRVDWQLLKNLEKLDLWLRRKGLEKPVSHALIGKYVYLRYLKDRDILSDRKLTRWDIQSKQVFGRNATLTAFRDLNAHLDEWLNGSVFPLAGSDQAAIKSEHLQRVAGAFSGDDPVTGQLHLDFEAYDFSHIPIETLSVIYQQFLHTPEREGEASRGRQSGAYYTPIPLVNFMLDKLDSQHALKDGMKVLDPACGSGAFLVQCYRRLIERRRSRQGETRLRPTELREILQGHIYGVDRDGDACGVAELSLILTLLDYVTPPDLENTSFKLPALRDANIFEADFFDPDSVWTRSAARLDFDWIVGNPPWLPLTRANATTENSNAWQWMQEHASKFPVGGHQLAEAFAWKVLPHVRPDGVVGLVLPATTLFKSESRQFRTGLFTRTRTWFVANFANMVYVLFAGRAQRPAAAFFYQLRNSITRPDLEKETIVTYAPFVANQQANRSPRPRRQQETWNIVVNASELRCLATKTIAGGEALPWKLAMWGSHRDGRLLQVLKRRFPALDDFAQTHGLQCGKGLELRHASSREEKVFCPDIVGKPSVDFTRLRECGRIFAFPPDVLQPIPRDRAYVRLRGGMQGLTVSKPPHIIVDASRRFAVYADAFIHVPSGQQGISAPKEQDRTLRALALYLSSQFATYHQFLVSPAWGVDTNQATLEALLQLPVPLDFLSPAELQRWIDLHSALVTASSNVSSLPPLSDPMQRAHAEGELRRLLERLNQEVYQVLSLDESERVLVEDFVNVRMKLVKGKVSEDAVTAPSTQVMLSYLSALQQELDGFIADQRGMRHCVVALHDALSAMICVELRKGRRNPVPPRVIRADAPEVCELERTRHNLRVRNSQWVYFDRSLRIYEGARTYLFKPMQRMLWTRSQARDDADEIIAETLAGAGG